MVSFIDVTGVYPGVMGKWIDRFCVWKRGMICYEQDCFPL
jgi:hypothetical protein